MPAITLGNEVRGKRGIMNTWICRNIKSQGDLPDLRSLQYVRMQQSIIRNMEKRWTSSSSAPGIPVRVLWFARNRTHIIRDSYSSLKILTKRPKY